MRKKEREPSPWRFYFLAVLLAVAFLGLMLRMVDLNVIKHNFLLKQGNSRTLRVIAMQAHRGMITDRNGVPLAISTPVDTVWVNPQVFSATNQQLYELSKLLHIPYRVLKAKVNPKTGRWFVYLKRRIRPEISAKIRDLHIIGLFLLHEYRRYYPEGEITSHVVGFTNIDDRGQEGLELAYDQWLRGIPGKREVMKDRLGHIIADMTTLQKPEPGHNLVLSIDNRIQYLAYKELESTVKDFAAVSGSIVVLDVKTGEILAMVNQPGYNPNDPPKRDTGQFRNRAVTDFFEPGSTMKAFSIASALASGKYTPNTIIDTNPGRLVVDGNVINDEHVNHGKLTVTGVLQKSSNIGVSKMTLSLPAEHLYNFLYQLGFGETTGSGFPGESTGMFVNHRIWRPFVLATLSYGYGIGVTPLQLANAYATIAAGGIKKPVTFLKATQPVQGQRVMSAKVAYEMLKMLESVVETGGTGIKANIPGYKVAGKTGTAYIAGPHGYNKSKYIADFVGIAPVSNPRLVVAVVIREPHDQHFGGLVAAPAFAKIMGDSLHILGVPPDETA